MITINNIKKIREIYGATQEEIAKVAGVNRSTVSQWETGATKASNSKLEKLSIYYGIGPECFYEIESLDDIRCKMLRDNADKEKRIKEESKSHRDKADELAQILENMPYKKVMSRYMFAMKLLLATSDHGELDDLKTAYEINQKMGKRLEAMIKIREEEEKAKKENDEETLYDLLDTFKYED